MYSLTDTSHLHTKLMKKWINTFSRNVKESQGEKIPLSESSPKVNGV